ncbi:hypothetical protein PS6_002254 [Mucor atramentarius]
MPTQSGGNNTIISSNAFGKFQTQEHVENDNLWNCVGLTLSNHPQGVPGNYESLSGLNWLNGGSNQVNRVRSKCHIQEYCTLWWSKGKDMLTRYLYYMILAYNQVINAEIALYNHLSVKYQSLLRTTALE